MTGLESLKAECEDWQRRIEDLRAFERDYRARLIAFHEGCLRDLTEGQS
jgi:hypothetical protein